MAGIVSYGFYVPKYRIKIEDIAAVWQKNPADVKKSLSISEKTVSAQDEDTLTMAYEASAMALSGLKISKRDIGAVFVGSETHPYAVNPTSTILAEFLGIEKNYLAYDTQFACKAATGAMISSFGLIKSDYTPYALVVGADKASAAPHDPLEYTASSGAVSFLLGKTDLILEVLDYSSFSSDTPDFWRRDSIRYPSHGGRFTGKPAYFYHIAQSSERLFAKTKLKPQDFSYAIFHMPNGKFPLQIGQQLGFEKKQIEKSLVVSFLGNSYSASSLTGLAAVLDEARSGNLIFLASYGSGAGSDAFVFRVTKNLAKRKKDFKSFIKEKKYVDYPQYLKFMGII